MSQPAAAATTQPTHHHQSFWSRYVFSFDHKVIGLQYYFTALVMAVVGGVLALLIRLQLAYPEMAWPALEMLMPNAFEGGYMKPEFYLSLVTMHGTSIDLLVVGRF